MKYDIGDYVIYDNAVWVVTDKNIYVNHAFWYSIKLCSCPTCNSIAAHAEEMKPCPAWRAILEAAT